jgi:hypothetical protein
MALVKKTSTPLSGACLTMPTRCRLSEIRLIHISFIKSDRYHGFHAMQETNSCRVCSADRILPDMSVHILYVRWSQSDAIVCF